MGRGTAVGVLCLFAALACLAGGYGVADIVGWRQDLAACRTPLRIDTSSFWFTGFFAIGLLPLLGLFRSERIHRFLLAAAVVLFVAPPFGVLAEFSARAQEAGYAGTANLSLFPPRALWLTLENCAGAGPNSG